MAELVKLAHPVSGVVVEVAPEKAARLVAQGWPRVDAAIRQKAIQRRRGQSKD